MPVTGRAAVKREWLWLEKWQASCVGFKSQNFCRNQRSSCPSHSKLSERVDTQGRNEDVDEQEGYTHRKSAIRDRRLRPLEEQPDVTDRQQAEFQNPAQCFQAGSEQTASLRAFIFSAAPEIIPQATEDMNVGVEWGHMSSNQPLAHRANNNKCRLYFFKDIYLFSCLHGHADLVSNED